MQKAGIYSEDSWQVHSNPTAVAAALDPRGLCEGALKKSIATALNSAGKLHACILPSMHVILPVKQDC